MPHRLHHRGRPGSHRLHHPAHRHHQQAGVHTGEVFRFRLLRGAGPEPAVRGGDGRAGEDRVSGQRAPDPRTCSSPHSHQRAAHQPHVQPAGGRRSPLDVTWLTPCTSSRTAKVFPGCYLATPTFCCRFLVPTLRHFLCAIAPPPSSLPPPPDFFSFFSEEVAPSPPLVIQPPPLPPYNFFACLGKSQTRLEGAIAPPPPPTHTFVFSPPRHTHRCSSKGQGNPSIELDGCVSFWTKPDGPSFSLSSLIRRFVL